MWVEETSEQKICTREIVAGQLFTATAIVRVAVTYSRPRFMVMTAEQVDNRDSSVWNNEAGKGGESAEPHLSYTISHHPSAACNPVPVDLKGRRRRLTSVGTLFVSCHPCYSGVGLFKDSAAHKSLTPL